jgi:lipopolysaccharide transport system ATP-binding protein
MSTVISVENLSKRYIIGHQKQQRYTALRDVLTEGAKRFTNKLIHPFVAPQDDPTHEEFWALKDVSFDIRQGDRVGIIGRNGAGKSTLLKILSRITEPTSGRVSIRGRVASLLEVGTGFHPELSGRENIYLNGAILGMSRAEISRKFDEIVTFAEVEKFLDTPVKRYSSGMYVRLAFAVAAHLEPEILIVDEVLAVGDAQFQKKCLGKMQDVGQQGRTVLFVSHNMNAIEQLCTSALRLESGKMVEHADDVRKIINGYLYANDDNNKRHIEWLASNEIYSSQWFAPRRLALANSIGQSLVSPISNDADDVWVWIEGDVSVLDPALQVGYAIYNEEGELLYWACHTDMEEESWIHPKLGRNAFKSKLPRRILNEGKYHIELLAALYCKQWLIQPGKNAPSIHLDIQGGLSDSPYWTIRRPGLLAPVTEWISNE